MAWLEIQPNLHHYKASDRYHKGISDIIVCVDGQFVGLELKKADGVTSPHQKLFIKQVTVAGGIAGICYTLGDAKRLIEAARQRASKI